jgi:hypothetical protein
MLTGRRPEWLRDFWMMHEVERHRGQMSMKEAVYKVSKDYKRSPRTVRKVYKREKLPTKRLTPETLERQWREFFRRHWRALQTDLNRRALLTDGDWGKLLRRHPRALVQEFYRRERCAQLTDRELREFYRCHPDALVLSMERQLEKLTAMGLEIEAEELRRRIEDLRSETYADGYFGA